MQSFSHLLWEITAQVDTPRQVAKQFCAVHNKRTTDKEFGGLITTDVAKLMQEAEKRDFEVTKGASNIKGPMGDWVPRGFLDWGKCRVGAVQQTSEGGTATVIYQYSKTESSDDQLMLTLENGKWKINDILYGAFRVHDIVSGPVYYKSSLRSGLKAIIDER